MGHHRKVAQVVHVVWECAPHGLGGCCLTGISKLAGHDGVVGRT